MPLRRRRVQELVQELLTSQKISEPPVPVDRIVRAQAIRIFEQSLDDNICGFIYGDSKKRVIGINTQHPKVRQRFTLAHELGHSLMHVHEDVHVDHGFQIQLRNDLSGQGIDPDEMEANLFAAELLMPKRFLEKDLRKLCSIDIDDDDILSKLAKRYGVSMQALAIRLTVLGYLSSQTEVSLKSNTKSL